MGAARCVRFVSLIAALGVLAACSYGEVPDNTHTAFVVSPTPNSSYSPFPSAAADTPVDALLDWSLVTPPAQGSPSYLALNDDALVAKLQNADGTEDLVLYSAADTQRLHAPHGGIIQNAYIVGDTIIFGVGVDETADFWIERWHPETGDTDVLYESTGRDSAWSETAMVAGTLYFTAPAEGERYCVMRMGVTSTSQDHVFDTVECVGPGEDLGWLKSNRDSVSFATLAADVDCFTLHEIQRGGRRATAVPVDGCVSRGIVADGVAAWTEPPEEHDGGVDFSHVRLRVEVGGNRINLGSSTAGSPAWCGGWLYWTVAREPGSDGHDEIRRWEPGHEIQTVYRSPDEGVGGYVYATSRPNCGDNGAAYFQRFGWWQGAGDELLAYPGLSWSPNVTPASPRP